MKVYKKQEVPARTEDRLSDITCDLCGRGGGDRDWDSGSVYERNETDVTLTSRIKTTVRVGTRQGTVYPEGGTIEEVEFDVCPDCFRGKLVPWLESQGAKPRKTEVDL